MDPYNYSFNPVSEPVYIVDYQTSGNPSFPNLYNIVCAILSIPHSNAENKRIFSLVRKNKNEY